MNIQRFTGATSREALTKARMAFGEGTLILSNRQTATGVEVMATTEDTLAGLDLRTRPASTAPGSAPQRAVPVLTAQVAPSTQQVVQADTEKLAMSTLSFQDYVRERMLRRRQTEAPARSDEGVATRPVPEVPSLRAAASPRQAPARVAAPASAPAPAAAGQASGGGRSIADELQAMRDLIEDRFNTFAWLGQTRQHPIHSNLMLKLMRAGYSPMLSRAILERMPEPLGAPEAMAWMMDALERNLRTGAPSQSIQDEGGIYALVGATGVGKTTTAAKLAGLCAASHGAASVGLITLDSHRAGGHEQLREHGRNLGIVAHLAHDRAALHDLLGLLANKRMVLIDTAGLAPRDPRKDDSQSLLDLPGVRRLLVLNAGTHGDTLDEVVGAYKAGETQEAVLSKLDEAVKLGPALDVAIRHQLLLRGVTTGQKVPQDLEAADASALVRASMRAEGKSAFDPKATDLGFFFMHPGASSGVAGQLHA